MSTIPYKSTSHIITQAMLLAGVRAFNELDSEGHADPGTLCMTLWYAMHNAAPELQGDLTGWIRTITGKRIIIANPEPASICIEDIAAGLAKVNRFNGQTDLGYTVAQHSWWVSIIVPQEHALQALLHDAAEAYLSDLNSPAKQLCHDYRRLESRFNAAIMTRFGLPIQHHSQVKAADLVMLATEKRDHMPLAADEEWPILYGVQPWHASTLTVLNAKDAERLFLDRFEELTGGQKA